MPKATLSRRVELGDSSSHRHRQSKKSHTSVIDVSSDDSFHLENMAPTTPRRQPNPPKSRASKDVIVISDDEDENPFTSRPILQPSLLRNSHIPATIVDKSTEDGLRARVRQLEVELQHERSLRQAAEGSNRQFLSDVADMEKSVTCEICEDKMFHPCLIRDCRHCFCEQCLADWFQQAATANPPQEFTCPKCRTAVKRLPIAQVYTITDMVSTLERIQSVAENRPISEPRRDPAIWQRMKTYFPKNPQPPLGNIDLAGLQDYFAMMDQQVGPRAPARGRGRQQPQVVINRRR